MKASPCILVVDNDSSIREFIVSALMDEGFRAVMAATPRMAREQLSSTLPCLLLLDLLNISSDDLTLVTEYRDLLGDEASVAVMSTAFDAQSVAKCVQADAVLSKPFSLNELFSVVSNCAHLLPLTPAS
jgi:DNA-binding response OmpR family regulator